MSRKSILNAKEGQVLKAGKLFFDAMFGDHKKVAEDVREDIVRDASSPTTSAADPDAITTSGFSFVRCSACAREQAVAADIDVRELERVGWRLIGGTWRCRFCVGAGK